jgi:hypothetical protein
MKMAGRVSTWCDKLAATPAFGFKLDTHFASGASILSALSPILDPLIDDEVQKFTLDQNAPFEISFTTEDGFKYGANHNRVHVTFVYRMKTRIVSGSPPVMEMLSRPAPYSELLPIVTNKAIEATLHVPSPKARKVRRVGVVAAVAVDAEDLPPGIASFLKYMGRPWGDMVDGFQIQITSQLAQDRELSDRCVHTLTRSEIPGEPTFVTFDWQRTFTEGQLLTKQSLTALSEKAKVAALEYFEELAEGNIFDEDILRNAD